MHKKVYEI